MRVIPTCSIQVGQKLICETLFRWDRALGYTWNAIFPGHSLLKDTMPMQRNTLIVHVVMNSDLDGVTPVCFNQRRRKLPVHEDCGQLIAVGGDHPPTDSEVVPPNDSSIWLVLIVIGLGIHGTPRIAIRSRVVSEESWQVRCIKRAIRGLPMNRSVHIYRYSAA